MTDQMTQKSQGQVQTDCGKADLFWRGPGAKKFKCPCCWEQVEFEWHYVLVPKDKGFRRHAHKECVEEFMNQHLEIKLKPSYF